MVPEERTTVPMAVCPLICEINATEARNLSTDINAQRRIPLPLAESKLTNRSFISADPNLPNICSTERSTASWTPCGDIGPSSKNFTRRYLCLRLFVMHRPPHYLDSIFKLWLFHPQAISSHNLERDIRYAPQRSVERKPEHI